nr:hypothetical protein [Methylomarinum sp. Ch1-1]MDP4520965.1 hypothetical protein [Methylomarinum sp. Ch1-1]
MGKLDKAEIRGEKLENISKFCVQNPAFSAKTESRHYKRQAGTTPALVIINFSEN